MNPTQWTGRQIALFNVSAPGAPAGREVAAGCDYNFIPAGTDHASAIEQARSIATASNANVAVMQADDGAFWVTRMLSHSPADSGSADFAPASHALSVRNTLADLKTLVRPDGELLEVPHPGVLRA